MTTPANTDAAPLERLSDHDALQAVAHLHDKRDWRGVVDLTDHWLAARGTLPAYACHFRSGGLQGIGEYEEALTWSALACQVLTPKPGNEVPFIASRIGLGQVLSRLGRWEDAMRSFRAALKVPTTDSDATVAKGHLRLCIKPGSWRAGWREHEARIGTDRSPTIPGVTEWDGQPTTGSVVVLHEQGIGDAILFARWLPWLAEVSGHPVIWAGPAFLHRWMQGVPGVGQCLDVSDALLEVEGESVQLAHGVAIVRAMSLPYHHGTTLGTIPVPARPPLPPNLTRRIWDHSPIRIGVCWAGAAGGHHDFERSIPAETFAHLWEPPIPHVEYVSLQYATDPPLDAPFAAMPTGDIYASAERIASCDLVVSVDTSVVHLAGSLNVPTICLTPTTPDWRYPDWPHGTETPYYPSVVVVRRDSAPATEDQVRTAKVLAEGMVQALRARHSV